MLAPDGICQLLPRYLIAVGQRKVGEGNSRLPTHEGTLPRENVTILDVDWPRQINAKWHTLQGYCKVTTSSLLDLAASLWPKEVNPMAKIIHCPCGFIVKGNTDDELVDNGQKHAREVHSKDISREEVLAMAVPAGTSPT